MMKLTLQECLAWACVFSVTLAAVDGAAGKLYREQQAIEATKSAAEAEALVSSEAETHPPAMLHHVQVAREAARRTVEASKELGMDYVVMGYEIPVDFAVFLFAQVAHNAASRTKAILQIPQESDWVESKVTPQEEAVANAIALLKFMEAIIELGQSVMKVEEVENTRQEELALLKAAYQVKVFESRLQLLENMSLISAVPNTLEQAVGLKIRAVLQVVLSHTAFNNVIKDDISKLPIAKVTRKVLTLANSMNTNSIQSNIANKQNQKKTRSMNPILSKLARALRLK